MYKWEWYWRVDDEGHADCGIFYEKRPGHVYSVCRCPKYLTKEQWTEIATEICDNHNKKIGNNLEGITSNENL